MKKVVSSLVAIGLLIFGHSLYANNNGFQFPKNAIVGYWGVQAPDTGTTLTEATDHGYNTIILSFAAVAGDNTNAPIANTGERNFYKGGSSTEGTQGAITFPSPTEYSWQENPQAISSMVNSLPQQLEQLNQKGDVVLLSIGGAGALLPQNLPAPQDFVDSFESLNNYFSKGSGKTLIQGIDWDLENGVDSAPTMDWAAKVSVLMKQKGFLVSCAPQSTNFNPTVSSFSSGVWNAYVPLIAAMDGAGTPIDAIMPQWYEPGGSRPAANTPENIESFINQYYNESWTVNGLPQSDFYQGTSFDMGKWLANNKKKLILGIGAGQGWNGVTNYTPYVLTQVYRDMNAEFGGYMAWDTEIDSGTIPEWAKGNWYIGDGLKSILSSSSTEKSSFI